MEPSVRFALIGAGGIAQTYAHAFEACDGVQLVGVADTRTEAARALAERFGCAAFADHRELADNGPQFDAVVICTPPNTHEEIALTFLARKAHVLCEKPFALDGVSARRMLCAADNAGVKITMASKFRYVEDVIRAKSIVTSGILGDVILFENAFTARVDMSGRWNSRPEISGGGVVIDNGSHSVDLMRYFLGPLARVHAVEGNRAQGLEVEDTARIFARSAGGVAGSIDLSWSVNKDLESYINIFGTHGTVQVGWKASRYRQFSSNDWVAFGRGYDKVQAFRNQLRNFARSILGLDTLLITGQDALASVEVIQAAYRSLRATHWTVIPAPGSSHSEGEKPEAVRAAAHPSGSRRRKSLKAG